MTKKANSASPSSAPQADPVARFESELKELEDIVGRMEHGDLPLEESLNLFERGVTLAKRCRDSLAQAELRVTRLLEQQDDAAKAPAAPPSDPQA